MEKKSTFEDTQEYWEAMEKKHVLTYALVKELRKNAPEPFFPELGKWEIDTLQKLLFKQEKLINSCKGRVIKTSNIEIKVGDTFTVTEDLDFASWLKGWISGSLYAEYEYELIAIEGESIWVGVPLNKNKIYTQERSLSSCRFLGYCGEERLTVQKLKLAAPYIKIKGGSNNGK